MHQPTPPSATDERRPVLPPPGPAPRSPRRERQPAQGATPRRPADLPSSAIGVSGLAAAGYEKEAGPLLRGVLAAAEAFGHRLPEMYGGEQRTEGSAPLPHPAVCRPTATAAAAGVLLLTTVAGIRPDVPAGTVTLRPLRGAPLGEVGLTGLRVSGAAFSVRVSRLGPAMVEEAADRLHLGV